MNSYEINVKDLAERTVKAQAWRLCKSMEKKRGGNPFEFATFVFARRLDVTTEKLEADIRNYIASNPMKYSATTKRLTYITK